jgi:hypothetical protein
MLENDIPVLEIPPIPAGVPFITCLTHDIDFVAQRHHRFDRAACGFFYRATCGTLIDFVTGRCSFRKVVRNAAAVAKWPLVQLGLLPDPWLPFAKYLAAEQGKPSTFFLIPFKNRCGKAPAGRDSSRRGVRYDLEDVRQWVPELQQRGCEVAVHGIDAWNDSAQGAEELRRLTRCTNDPSPGVRMHWLYFADDSPKQLEAAGFPYDSTCGYNDAVGYRAGTTQVFRPIGVAKLLELPLHMQDTAMFFPGRMHLKEPDAWQRFLGLLEHAEVYGGVFTVLWHDRSLAPERLWDDFYSAVLERLSQSRTWFATARDVVSWFAGRRQVQFRAASIHDGELEVGFDNVPGNLQRDLVARLTVPGSGSAESVRIDVPLAGRSEVRFKLPGIDRAAKVPATCA